MPIVRVGVFLIFFAVGCWIAIKGLPAGRPWVPTPQQVDRLASAALVVCFGGVAYEVLRRRHPFFNGGVPRLGGGESAPNIRFLAPLLSMLTCAGVLWRSQIWAQVSTLFHTH